MKKIYTLEFDYYINNKDCEDTIVLGVFSSKKKAKKKYEKIGKTLKIKKHIHIRSIPLDMEYWEGGFSTYKYVE